MTELSSTATIKTRDTVHGLRRHAETCTGGTRITAKKPGVLEKYGSLVLGFRVSKEASPDNKPVMHNSSFLLE